MHPADKVILCRIFILFGDSAHRRWLRQLTGHCWFMCLAIVWAMVIFTIFDAERVENQVELK